MAGPMQHHFFQLADFRIDMNCWDLQVNTSFQISLVLQL